MTYFIKMGYIMGFPNLFVVEMDGVGVLQSPFPNPDWKFSIEIDDIHDIGTEIKWRKVPCGGGSLLTLLRNSNSWVIR
jgi:hypothetical protein